MADQKPDAASALSASEPAMVCGAYAVLAEYCHRATADHSIATGDTCVSS
jgi:hypothetical protein